jgi:D-alanyl-D-alanine carboxypeptidase/D-alanyl-D-alanine-endopeptidase (penicillin-binding protein 4)
MHRPSLSLCPALGQPLRAVARFWRLIGPARAPHMAWNLALDSAMWSTMSSPIRWGPGWALIAALSGAMSIALAGAAAAAEPTALPPEVARALQRAQVPADALSVVVQEAGDGLVRLSLRPRQPVNPGSLIKLATTYAALDTLGPAWVWRTPVWLQGPVHNGVLEGNVHIKGSGDPKLTVERVWLLLRRLQQFGISEIRGDIVLDRSAFSLADVDPGEFDGEPLRPYNVRPDALLLNYKAVQYTFMPDADRGVARVGIEPPLAGVSLDERVPLAAGNAGCGDWRGALKATMADPQRVSFEGTYAATCGERVWPVAYPDPASYNARLLLGMWRAAGGSLTGMVRDGPAPVDFAPSFELQSPALAEVVRDINKFSNNVMAQQLFLTLAAQVRGSATEQDARDLMGTWLQERLGEPASEFHIDNGSGLSRDTRVTAALLAKLLHSAWRSPVMSELMSSLPVSGLDGTLRRSRAQAGQAHLKTGSLRDVAGVAGYVLGASGRRYVLVAVIHHANANAARPALDALVQWTLDDNSVR